MKIGINFKEQGEQTLRIQDLYEYDKMGDKNSANRNPTRL